MNNEEKILEMLEKHGEMLEKLSARMDKMDERMDKMQDEIHLTNVRIELDVGKRLDAINEGIDTILETMVSKSRVEQLEDDVIVLKTAVKMLTQEVAELKKAQ